MKVKRKALVVTAVLILGALAWFASGNKNETAKETANHPQADAQLVGSLYMTLSQREGKPQHYRSVQQAFDQILAAPSTHPSGGASYRGAGCQS